MSHDQEIKVCFNRCSREAFDKLPGWVQDTIIAVQTSIHNAVLRVFPGARPTSGFRCGCENARVGGQPHSLHLWGLARDYAPSPDWPSRVPRFKVIKERNCVHVQVDE